MVLSIFYTFLHLYIRPSLSTTSPITTSSRCPILHFYVHQFSHLSFILTISPFIFPTFSPSHPSVLLFKCNPARPSVYPSIHPSNHFTTKPSTFFLSHNHSLIYLYIIFHLSLQQIIHPFHPAVHHIPQISIYHHLSFHQFLQPSLHPIVPTSESHPSIHPSTHHPTKSFTYSSIKPSNFVFISSLHSFTRFLTDLLFTHSFLH